ncbi:RNA-guided endonuclease InsQ/TnpB family protein [Candidatus Uabimicrobium sp. HlEnr_7]|uniref:RNA-guided endonuclease InsQ/TnpB family protein n=1 Tax=Candidatus Uabimicrobium helgolandensis TaxID=3095367 RepID=UPI0035578689
MKLVEKHNITKNNKKYSELDDLSFRSKNLYNAGLYVVRQNFFAGKGFIGYENLQKELQQSKQPDYYALPTKVSQQILRVLCKNFESFFRGLEGYKINPNKFKAKPKLPKYKHKSNGRNIVLYPIDAINKKELTKNKIKLSMCNITLSCQQKHIKQVRIVPRYGMYKIEIVYEKSVYLLKEKDITSEFLLELQKDTPISLYLRKKCSKILQEKIENYKCDKPAKLLKKAIADKLNSLIKTKIYNKDIFDSVTLSKVTKQILSQKPKEEKLLEFNRLLLEDCYKQLGKHKVLNPNLDKNKIAGIDIGLNNLAAITSNQKDFTSVLINGRPLKSINQFFNKKRSCLMSYIGNKGTSRRIEKLTYKRNCVVSNYLHQSSRYIIKLLVEKSIGTLVIGKNDDWKQQINIGKRNNQNFVSIPHSQFVNQLTYKAQLAGIEVLIQEESYTSKCSFLDSEPIKKHQNYLGRRVKRGLFRSKQNILLNADINGAANIIRKAIPNAFANGIEGIVVFPKRITPF